MDPSPTCEEDTMLRQNTEESTAPAPAVSRLKKIFCSTRRRIGILVVVLVVVVVVVVVVSICVSVKISSENNSVEQASTHGTAEQTGSMQEVADPDKHIISNSAEGVRCKASVVPYKINASDKSDYSASKYIHNSSCLLCTGKCKNLDELENRTFCNNGTGPITVIKNCDLKRDMKNMDEGVCGGAGKYVCYLEKNEPECNCTNNMKVGDLCQHETEAPCKCWTSKLPIEDQENIPNCLDPKQIDEWTKCIHDFDHDFKCLCNNTENSGALGLPDCNQARTHAQKGTNCGSNVHVSMVVSGVIMLIHGYKYYLN